MTGTLDRLLEHVLIIMRNARDPAGQNFAALSDKLLQRLDVFVVDQFDFTSNKGTVLALFAGSVLA